MTATLDDLRTKAAQFQELKDAAGALARLEQQQAAEAQRGRILEAAQQAWEQASAALASYRAAMASYHQDLREAQRLVTAATATHARAGQAADVLRRAVDRASQAGLAAGPPDWWRPGMPLDARMVSEQFLLDAGITPSAMLAGPAGIDPGLLLAVEKH